MTIHEPPILITGAARSGTSMTAGIFDLCGGFGGKMRGATQFNKRGMFENSMVVDGIVKPYLSWAGVDPMLQNPLPDPKQLPSIDEFLGRPLREAIHEIFQKQGYKKGKWYYKGAKMSLLWSLFHNAFPNAKWVIVRRRKDHIVNSCMKTHFMRNRSTEKEWEEWVDIHEKEFVNMHEAGLQVKEVWPSKFIEGDFREIIDIIEWCGMKWNGKSVSEFVEPALFSNRKKRR